MLWTYNSMSVWEKIRRLINSQKFYATLPSKLDRAEEQWHASQPEDGPDVTVTEYEPDGSEAQILLGALCTHAIILWKNMSRFEAGELNSFSKITTRKPAHVDAVNLLQEEVEARMPTQCLTMRHGFGCIDPGLV